MNKDEAFRLLERGTTYERLIAARQMQEIVLPEDRQRLRQFLGAESDAWVRRALQHAIGQLEAASVRRAPSVDQDTSADLAREVYAQAVEETAGRLVHEIRSIVGEVRLDAEKEIESFEGSRTDRSLQRLIEMLHAIDTLSKAAASPAMAEFALSEALRDIVTPYADQGIEIELAGPESLQVVADRGLVSLVVANGVRNAVEAVQALSQSESEPILIVWDRTERDYWIAVLDRGVGIPSSGVWIFEIGATTKTDHLGLGLATAMQAAQSLGGTLTLSDRADGGTRLELRWPLVDGRRE